MPRKLAVWPRATSKWTYANLLLLIVLMGAVSLISTSGVAMALPKIPDGDEEAPLLCELDFSVQATLSLEGLPLTGAEVQISATNAKIQLVEPNPDTPRLCEISFHPLGSQFQWQLAARPAGSAATLGATSSLRAELTPEVAGQYRVRFTACPDDCDILLLSGATLPVPPATRELTIDAVSQLALPPETEPLRPPLPFTSPTAFPDASDKCAGGGGFIDPQWVTVNEWHGAQDYELLEGGVRESHISRKDNPLNHDSQDFLVFVDTDPPYHRLRASGQGDLEVEWERSHYPEVFRSTRGDRVSIVGYWIHDCGHSFKTEIHPPAMVATHRARPVQIPAAEGFGSNVFVPGIMTHIWINQDAGETTRNCSLTGLHQPSGGGGITFGPHLCLPQTEGFDRNPINRIFEFNIYLPRNPQDILADVGREAPPVPLYRQVLNPLGGGGPDPVIFVCPDSGPDICQGVSESDITYLRVRIDLRSFTGRTYSRKIAAAWVYPAPDNWGIKRWKFRIKSMNVHDDGDSRLRGDGDWRFWANTNNEGQEWTKLFDCDGCVHGTVTFSGRPWETGSADPNRSLGPDLLLFPDQRIWVHTSGFEEDWIISDSTGHVSDLRPQVARAYSTRSKCRSSGTSGCASYTLNYEILEGAPVGPATLSGAGQAIFDGYVITNEDPFSVERLPDKLKRHWNLPDDMTLEPGQPPVFLDDTDFFSPQGVEIFALTDISVDEFNRAISSARQVRPEVLDRALTELREEVDLALASPQGAEVMEELTPLLEALPEDLKGRYFGDVELPAGTAFTYQGRLMDGGNPANGEYDFRFALHDREAGDSQQLLPFIEQDNLLVADGMFTVQLDFGDVFDGGARWLEVSVRRGDSTGAFTPLSPRQPLSPTPYAIYASGGPFWALNGNSDTIPGPNFLGTTDNQPLVFKTSGTEAMRIGANGNVGIGTAGPATKLHIVGGENNGVSASLRITGDNRAQNLLMDGNEIDALADGLFLNNNSDENVVLANGGGRVGIGTSSPGATLDVNGGARSSTLGTGGIGFLGRSDSRAIVGVVGPGSCAGTYGVGGCAPSDVGVLGATDTGIGVVARTNNSSGTIFVGQTGGANRARINSDGRGFFNGGTQVGGADFAESLRSSDTPASLEPGDVLVIDPESPLAVKKSGEANSRLVAGVYSTRPAVLAIGDHHIDDSLEGEVPVAVVGIVPTKVTAENGPIHVGDLLVTSSLPGHAMKARPAVVDGVEIYPTGAVLGKALEPLEEGTGVVRVLVMLR